MYNVEPYPVQLQNLQTFQGFLEEYYARFRREPVESKKTSKDIYEDVEQDHKKYFGVRKYNSYQSFRVMRARKAHEK